MLGKNDRIEVEGFDDPDVQGIACYISYAKKGGLKETVNLEEDASDASVSCVQSAEVIRYNEAAVLKPRQVFKRSASIAFKSQQIIRYYDPKRKSFAYLVYSDKNRSRLAEKLFECGIVFCPCENRYAGTGRRRGLWCMRGGCAGCRRTKIIKSAYRY